MLFVNFKTYEEGTGERAVDLTRILEEVALDCEIKIIPVVQAGDIREVVQMTKLEVWTQHVDPVDFGAHTGLIIPQSVVDDGAVGTFLNHSEHKFVKFEELTSANKMAQKAGLKTLIFAVDIDELEKIIRLKPTYVAYEPPELVGSKTTSVSQAKPEVIAKAVEISKNAGLPLIVGAGIKSIEDVRTSVELGAVGVAVASDIVKSKDPKKAVEELVQGFE
jgi:triosephosphate isomerase